MTATLCSLSLVAAALAIWLAGAQRQVAAVSFNLPQLAVKTGFPKWGSVLERDWARDAAFSKLCSERLNGPCNLADWNRFLDGLQEAPFPDRIAAVNDFVNRVGYREDDQVWGVSDYWAAPGEFFAKGGDCEDYAIAKYFSLRALGVPAERMSIVVLQDKRRRIPHAVLTVRWAGPDLVLDNLSDEVKVWPQLPHYQPVYRVSESDYEIFRSRGLARLLQSAGS